MKRVDIPTTTLRRYTIAAEESGIGEQKVIATPVCIDTAGLLADLVVKARRAESLESMGASIATTLIGGAVVYDGRRAASHGMGHRL